MLFFLNSVFYACTILAQSYDPFAIALEFQISKSNLVKRKMSIDNIKKDGSGKSVVIRYTLH